MDIDNSLDLRLADAGDTPVLLFFGSESCGPTIRMFETLADFEDQVSGVEVMRIAIEDDPQSTQRFMVKATPTTILFRRSEPLGTVAGTMSLEQMADWVDTLLRPKPEKATRKKASH